MKHVFCIHSSITFLMMKGIIEQQQISIKDVIVFTRRNYSFDWPELKTLPLHAPFFWQNREAKGINKLISKIKEYLFPLKVLLWTIEIRKQIGFKRCKLYIPNSSIHEWNLLSSPFFSKKFYYIEEGSKYYTKNWSFVRTKKISFIESFRYIGLKKYERLFDEKVTQSYVFSKKVRTEIPKQFVLSLNSILEKLPQMDNKPGIILAIDGGSTFNQTLTIEQHTSTVRNVLQSLFKKSNETPLSYKLHPNQYNSPIELKKFRDLIKEYFPNAIELGPKTILERYLGEKHKIIIAGDSSICLYAYLLGCPIETYIFQYSSYCMNYTKEKLAKKYSSDYIKFLKEHEFTS